jgi:hypothetical protein
MPTKRRPVRQPKVPNPIAMILDLVGYLSPFRKWSIPS